MTPGLFNEIPVKCFERIVMGRALGIDVARNELVKEFLESDCEWLLFMDDDVVCPRNIMDLFTIDRAMIVAPYSNGFQGEPIISVYQWQDEKREFLEIMPHAAMLDVLERCKAAGVRPIYPIADMVGNCYAVRREVFPLVVDEDGEWYKQLWRGPSGELRRGEDTYFFRRCNEMGIKVHVAFDVRAGHHKMVDLAQLYDAYRGAALKFEKERSE